jgi:hypothetical protein
MTEWFPSFLRRQESIPRKITNETKYTDSVILNLIQDPGEKKQFRQVLGWIPPRGLRPWLE